MAPSLLTRESGITYIHQKQNDEEVSIQVYKYCCHGISIVIDKKTTIILNENQLKQLTKQSINYLTKQSINYQRVIREVDSNENI